MDVRTLVEIKKVIWEQLLASKSEIIIRDLSLPNRKKLSGEVIFLTFQTNINLDIFRNDFLVKKDYWSFNFFSGIS